MEEYRSQLVVAQERVQLLENMEEVLTKSKEDETWFTLDVAYNVNKSIEDAITVCYLRIGSMAHAIEILEKVKKVLDEVIDVELFKSLSIDENLFMELEATLH